MFLRASKTGGQTYWRVVETTREGRWPRHRTVFNLGRHDTREAAQAAWDARLRKERAAAGTVAEPIAEDCAFGELGLRPDATAEQVRAAYRRLATANHPDRGGNPDAMVKINDAYEKALEALGLGRSSNASHA